MRREGVFVMGSEASASPDANTSASPTNSSPLERGVAVSAAIAHAHRPAALWARGVDLCQCVSALCALAHTGGA